jgi:DNA-binding LytR/AlgR family response regulator
MSPILARLPVWNSNSLFELKNHMQLLPAIQTQGGRRAAPLAESEESKPHRISPGAFVLLTDDSKCRLARIESISILEAFQNATFVHFDEGKLFIRRSLVECERRLDNSIFVRASRDCIVNLSQVKQPRLLKDGRLIFILKDEREVVFSRRQSVLFRTLRGL